MSDRCQINIPQEMQRAVIAYNEAREAYSDQYNSVQMAKISLNSLFIQREKAKTAMMVAIQTPDRM